MKRVNAITKGKASCITDLIDRKAKRIMRAVEQAIDCASDKVDSCKDSAEDIINSFGEYAGSDETMALQSRINTYLDKVAEAEGWADTVKRLKALKDKLNAEVEISEE